MLRLSVIALALFLCGSDGGCGGDEITIIEDEITIIEDERPGPKVPVAPSVPVIDRH